MIATRPVSNYPLYATHGMGAGLDQFFDITPYLQPVIRKEVNDAMLKAAIGGAVLLVAIVGSAAWVKYG